MGACMLPVYVKSIDETNSVKLAASGKMKRRGSIGSCAGPNKQRKLNKPKLLSRPSPAAPSRIFAENPFIASQVAKGVHLGEGM
jgi:hypothetical protein